MSPVRTEPVGGAGERRLSVVFVGAFREAAKDGAVGGSLFAARGLVASPLAEHLHWVLVDSTIRSVPPPPVPVRAMLAAGRLARFVFVISSRRTDAVLLFAGNGLGFVEKGLMAVVSKAARKAVLLSPRSGLMPDEIERSRLRRWLVRKVLAKCDRIICQGATWQRFYQELTGLPPGRVVSIPNWIDLREYRTIRPAGSRLGPPVFLYLGWLEPYKGVFDLIHAVDRGREALAGARVIICGRGSSLSEATRLTAELGLEGTIAFRGWVLGKEKRAVLAESDVLVLPSRREGMPNALLEAMAAGLPVIATRIGAIADVVEDGTSGLLVEAGNIGDLAGALVRLTGHQEERARMGRAAQERIAVDHDIAVVWPRVLAAIRGAVEESRAS